ncbi:MAG: YdeI/OmpD-associated family protein [Pseudomonas sp.]
METKPKFFARQSDFRRWLEKNHKSETELWVGYYKTGTGKPSINWPQSVDEALCFGWIDGLRKSIDEDAYMIRFSPRKATSIWSTKNIKRAQELKAQGLMKPAGLAAFEKRREDRTRQYSFEQVEEVKLGAEYEKKLRANKKAWAFYQAQPPGYRKIVNWYVISARKEETRLKRLDRLITDCAAGKRIGLLGRERMDSTE